MARFLFIILTFTLVVACEQRPGDIHVAPAKSIPFLPYSIENRRLVIDNFIPAHYNIELIEYDTLHPVMQITYSTRRSVGDSFDWVDTVLRLPMSVQQSNMLKQLLYGEQHFSHSYSK